LNVPAARSAIRFAVLCAATAVCLLVAATSAFGFGFLTKWGTTGSGAGQFDAPSSIATDADGNVYVGERDNERIQVFDSSGEFLRMWGWGVDTGANAFQICTSSCQAGIEGSGIGQLDNPFGLDIAPNGNLYVADQGNDRIQIFTPSGNPVGGWGVSGTAEGQFTNPGAITTDPMGNVYVADTSNNRIQKFTSAGSFVRTWGWGVDNGSNAFQICFLGCQQGLASLTPGDGQFFHPNSIAADADADIYVGESENNRVQKFNLLGNFLTKWGTEGTGNGQFIAPGGIAVDPSGDIYVGDGGNDRIQRWSNDGDFLLKFGSFGTGDGQFDGPTDVASDSEGNLYVVEFFGDRVQKFGGGPPATSITKAPKKKTFKRKVRFKFSADQADATFECKLDKKQFKACESPFETMHLKRARHRFKVRAIDLLGVPDPTPAKRSWKVRKR
jgi:tripartite motif-containing protein 71